MKLRCLRNEEIPQLRGCLMELAAYHNRVANEFAGDYPIFDLDAQLDYLAGLVAKGEGRVEAVFENGEIAGFCEASHSDGHGDIGYLFLRKSLRGKGLGERLLNSAVEYLKKNGVAFIDIKVVAGNPARHFYEKQGFRVRSETMSQAV